MPVSKFLRFIVRDWQSLPAQEWYSDKLAK